VKGARRAGRIPAASETRDYPRVEIEPPGPRARELIEMDRAVTSSCYIKVYPLAVARGRGPEDLFTRRLDPADVAAMVVEPIQGEGGYIVPPKDYLVALRELCDRHGILLVADEVQTGVGRTGRMFACDHAEVEPDILLTAKGLGSGMPIGAIVAREEVDTWESGAHGSTFGGNPVCCAAALATLDLVEGELVENAARMGQKLLEGSCALAERHPVIGDVRGLGLLVGLELVDDRDTRIPAHNLVGEIVQRAFRKGLLLLDAGESVIRLLPPLIVDEYDVDTAMEILDETLGEVV